MKTACSEGFMPYIDACGECRSKKDLKYFDCVNGCIVCDNCIGEKKNDRNFVSVQPSTLKLLSFLIQSDMRSVFSIEADKYNLGVLSEISEKYMLNTLEIYLPALSYLKSAPFWDKNV